jgi:HSP20 family protein
MSEKATATQTALAPVPAKDIEPQNLFEQFDRIYQSIAKRAFEIFEGDGRSLGHELDNWFKAESELLHPVKINMTETETAVTVQAEVPGFTAKDIEIRLEPRRLTISGEKETHEEKRKGKAIFQENRSNKMLRVIDLPADVDTEKPVATLQNGILELQLSKNATKRESKAVRVQVKSA